MQKFCVFLRTTNISANAPERDRGRAIFSFQHLLAAHLSLCSVLFVCLSDSFIHLLSPSFSGWKSRMPFAIFMLMVFLSIDNNFITTAAIAAYRRVYVFYDLQRLFGKVFPHFVIGSRNNFFFRCWHSTVFWYRLEWERECSICKINSFHLCENHCIDNSMEHVSSRNVRLKNEMAEILNYN